MAKLTAAQRRKLPSRAFAIPHKRAYPIPNENHARQALCEVKVHGTAEEQCQVRAAVTERFPDLEQQP